MKWKNYILSATLLLINIELVTNQLCQKTETSAKSIIRGNYQNVLNMNRGGVVSRLQNRISNEGSCLRDNIYIITEEFGYTLNLIGSSIIFELQQTYELNTLKIWFWDLDDRFYTITAYVILNNIETIIYQGNRGQSITTITFPVQQVQKFKILNVNGNTYNIVLHIIKAEAYFRLQTYM